MRHRLIDRPLSFLCLSVWLVSGCSDTLPAPTGSKDASVDVGQVTDSTPAPDLVPLFDGPAVDAAVVDTTVDTVSPDTLVDTVSPDATLDAISPDASVDTVSPDATVDTISPDATVDSISPDATMDAEINWGTFGWSVNPNNPVLGTGNSSDFDHGSVGSPVVVFNQGVYQMWYTATNANGVGAVGYAVSTDGVSWSKKATASVVALGGPGSFDEKLIEPVSVVVTNGNYEMWYLGNDAQTNIRTGYAISVDGLNWAKLGGQSILPVGAPGAWDGLAAIMLAVHRDASGYVGIYGGVNSLGTHAYGQAVSSDGISWLKHGGNPVLSLGGKQISGAIALVKTGSTYQLWYPVNGAGAGTNFLGIYYASSTDAITWTEYPLNPVLGAGNFGLWAPVVESLTVLRTDPGNLKLWFSGDDGAKPSPDAIGFATHP